MPNDMCEWKPKYLPVYKCQEPPLSGDINGYCILHSEREDKDIDEFTRKVDKRMTIGRLTPSGWLIDNIDLVGCHFPENFPAHYFRGRTFGKPVDFSHATFSQAADFSGATFSQAANFTRATFSREADFSLAKFSQTADFTGAKFSQQAYFHKATFSQTANFRRAEFLQWAGFSRATFLKAANFYWATFLKAANFNMTKFTKESNFRYTRFDGQMIRFQDVDLSGCSFLHSNIDKVDFRYCTFGKEEI